MSINIKHYKYYRYNSNVLIYKKEMFSDFTDCAMLLGLLTIIWRAALGHTGPCTSRIMQWKILHLFPIPRLRWILPAPIVVRWSPCLAAFRAYISCIVVQKRWYPKRNSKSFCWINNRHKWNGDYTHQLIGFFRFPADVAKHCPHYIKPAFIVSRRLW